MALMMRGMVINGPTPIMSIMFSAVAGKSPISRLSSDFSVVMGYVLAFVSRGEKIHIEPDCVGHARGKLAEKCVAGVNVSSLAQLGLQ